MERIATTLLDLAGLLLVAAGAYYLVEPHMGRGGMLVAGGVLLAGSAVASRESTPSTTWPRLTAWLRARFHREGAA